MTPRRIASEGKISFELVEQAIRDMTSEGGKFFGQTAAAAGTLEGKVSTLESAFENLKDAVGQDFLGGAKSGTDALSGSFDNLARMIRSVQRGEDKLGKRISINPLNPVRLIMGGLTDQFTQLPPEVQAAQTKAADAKAAKEAEKARQDELNKKRKDFEAQLTAIQKDAANDRLETEERIKLLKEQQATFEKANGYEEALKVAKEIANLENEQWKKENQLIDQAAKEKMRYEEEVSRIVEERHLNSMKREEQIAYLKKKEAQALAEEDYGRAQELLRMRSTLQDAAPSTSTLGVADQFRRNGALSGYFAPRIQEKTLSVAEQSRNFLMRIADNTTKLKQLEPGESWDGLE